MENAAYVGLSRQMTLRRELDIVANNIANADTTGFKVEQLMVGTEIGRARPATHGVRPVGQLRAGQRRGPRLRPGRAAARPAAPWTSPSRAKAPSSQSTTANGEAYTRDGALHPGPGRPADHPGRRRGAGRRRRDHPRPRARRARRRPRTAPSARTASVVGSLAVVRFDTCCRFSRRAATASTATPPTPAPSDGHRRPGPPGHAGRLQRQADPRDHQPDRDQPRLRAASPR